NHQRVLECACGMLRKQTIEEKGECKMALDTECRSRDYLYGRLLAVADAAEESTYDRESSRTTNAKRFFEAFSNRPCRTWGVIYNHLRPYFDRMPAGRRVYYERMIGEISEMFSREDFINNAPLKPEFLHAYSCQLNEIYRKKTDIKEDK
ncbi:MAG: type I-C CRISPR-associated protein Cas8c/Csd1, partial [Oscillospiraceae bacterium]